MPAWKAELWLLVVTIIWGATYLFTQIGLESCSPSMYVLIRFGISLTVLLVFFGKHLRGIDRTTVKQGLILGAMYGVGFLLQTFSLKYTSVPKASFITGLVVCTVPFVFWFIDRRRIKLWQIVGVVVATVGLLIFTQPDLNNLNIGDILALISTIVWGFYLTYMDIFTQGSSSNKRTIQLVVLQYSGLVPMAFITLLLFDSGDMTVVWNQNLIISLLFNAIISSVIVSFIHTAVQKYSTPVKAGLLFSLEPIVATALAVAYYGVPLKGFEVIGGVMLMAGVLISELLPLPIGKKKHS